MQGIKNIIAMMLVFVTLSGVAFAAGNHPMAGCGFGYVLFGHEDNNQFKQICAATTNGSSANQTFGITSGTSGCTDDGALVSNKEIEVFVDVNFDSLRREMAVGEGDFVDTLARLLGASTSRVPDMVQFFHDQYAELFPDSQSTSAQLISRLQEKLSSRKDLLS